MQNIDPVFILQPVVVIAICVGLLAYWRRRRHFSMMVLFYSLVAYAVAIALKYAVQIPTINAALDAFGPHSIGMGVYYGAQTVFFEVGLAYAVAWYLVKRGRIGRKDAEGYGAGLAFWENAVLLGALSLINLVTYYAVLSTNSSLAQNLYNLLSSSSPDLFDPVTQALGLVALGTVERFSSVLLHLAWGYLCVMAAVYNRRSLFLIALPMGLVDFLVPFSATIGLVPFEAMLLAIAVAAVSVAWYATRRLGQGPNATPGSVGEVPQTPPSQV